MRNQGVAVADVMSALDERVILTAGCRYQEVLTRSFGITPGPGFGMETDRYEANKLTPAAAVVVKPVPRLSLYANYIESLQAGPTAPTTVVNPGQLFPPFTARQVEFGAKYDFGQVGVAASVFQITQPSAFTDPVTNRFGTDGEQRNRGIELNVFGEPLPGVRLLGGGAALDATLTKTAGGALKGRTAPGVPNYQLSLYGEYDLPRPLLQGVTLTGRVLHSGRQFYDPANTQQIPAWTRFDLGARFAVQAPYGKPIVLRANVENVLDSNYYQTAIDGLLSQGAARTFLLSTQLDF